MTGAAWLPSARVVRCPVNSVNERNLCPVLYFSQETAWVTGRKEEMTSNQHGSYALGYTRATMASTTGLQSSNTELILIKLVQVRIEGCNSPS